MKKVYEGFLYLKLKKVENMEIPLCNFLNNIGIDVDPFDRSYEDVNDEFITGSNNYYKVFLVGCEKTVHLLISYPEEKFQELKKLINSHLNF